MKVKLFSTDGCHLCEQAIGMFYYAKQQSLFDDSVELEIIDIVCDELLTEKYGHSIPVLQYGQRELNWPFELEELVEWIKAQSKN